ncbi:MAG: DUF5702 domain-containing protein [Lachnospiraceae bacterium]|nr:DUF5702 domain-containing protein [Lachnospiraceae bacterium]
MRYRRKNQGIITVFVTLIMVPVVVFVGVFVDVARLKLCSSQAVMAADAYGEVVLSEYQNVLKELYGLFAVTQSDDGLQAIKDLSDYVGYSFNPAGEEDSGLSGFMPYATSDIKLEYTAVENASLANDNVMMTQVAEFMQYRIIEDIADAAGILDAIEEIDGSSADMEAAEQVQELAETSSEALEEIVDYYEVLKDIKEYPAFITQLTNKGQAYAAAINFIKDSDEYAAYYEYVNKSDQEKEEIETAVEKVEELQKQIEEIKKKNGTVSDELQQELAEAQELADKYVDAEEFKDNMKDELEALEDCKTAAYNFDSTPVDFDNIDGKIEELNDITFDLTDPTTGTLSRIEGQVNTLKSQLTSCSEETREGIEEEIGDLEEITEENTNFIEVNSICQQNIYNDPTNNESNERSFTDALNSLDEYMDALLDGNLNPGEKISFSVSASSWKDFYDAYKDFYDWLEEKFGGDGSGTSGKDEADRQIDNADSILQEKKDALNAEDDQREANDIPSALASELGIVDGSGVSKDSALQLSSGFTLEKTIDRFLLASYDFGMFSSRVSGQEESDQPLYGVLDSSSDDDSSSSDSSEEYADYSLTKVKMSTDVNYLYGAELEYLLGGHLSSKENQNAARNEINTIRMALNLVSTYKISEVNKAINNIANAAAQAVTATGVGAAAAPLVKIAVSAALRAAVAGIETYADWNLLKERQRVVLLKTELSQLSSLSEIKSLLSGEDVSSSSSSSEKKTINLNYENYLYLLMYLYVDSSDLVQRTGTLITLNVNQAMRSTSEKDSELTSEDIEFNILDSVTAVQSTCLVRMDFVILPDNFAQMYLNGTDTESILNSLENQYIGYSVIRGY